MGPPATPPALSARGVARLRGSGFPAGLGSTAGPHASGSSALARRPPGLWRSSPAPSRSFSLSVAAAVMAPSLIPQDPSQRGALTELPPPSARALGRYRQRLPRRRVLGGRVPGAPSYVAGSPSPLPGFWPLVASAFCPGCPGAGCGSLQASSSSPSAPTSSGPLLLARFLDQSVHRRGAGGSSQAVPRWQSPAVPRGPQTTAAGYPRVPSGTAAASGDLRLLPFRAQRCGPPCGSCLLATLPSPSSSLSPEFEFLHLSRP